MEKLFTLLAGTAGSALGWWAGGHVGIMTAWTLSMVGFGFGLYWGRRIARDYF